MAKRNLAIFTTPSDAALAFYQAFEARDLDAMMATWADDEEIVCVHPGGPRLVGFDAIRAAWEQIFANDVRLTFRIEDVVTIDTVGLALQSGHEHIYQQDGTARGVAVVTNVVMRTPSGWRIVCHHASPAPPAAAATPSGPLH
ncbi:MAG: nuclear transport factor 2 family protein [Proteobacteria bacterium]|nr:nuclear transport factor 2 family protein [Pseudomonadota bacterium]